MVEYTVNKIRQSEKVIALDFYPLGEASYAPNLHLPTFGDRDQIDITTSYERGIDHLQISDAKKTASHSSVQLAVH